MRHGRDDFGLSVTFLAHIVETKPCSEAVISMQALGCYLCCSMSGLLLLFCIEKRGTLEDRFETNTWV